MGTNNITMGEHMILEHETNKKGLSSRHISMLAFLKPKSKNHKFCEQCL